MGLALHPDFQQWLARYLRAPRAAAWRRAASAGGDLRRLRRSVARARRPPPRSASSASPSSTDATGPQSAARIANALRLAIADDDDTPATDIREAVEEVLEGLRALEAVAQIEVRGVGLLEEAGLTQSKASPWPS